MGNIDIGGDVVLVYLSTPEGPEERKRVLLVRGALAAAHRNNKQRGFPSSIQIEETEGDVIYSQAALAAALARMSEQIEKQGYSIEVAAKQVAEEDGES